jgi:FAD synthetase
MTRVMVFGSFDVVHEGHKYFLQEAKKLGELVVVVARDKNYVKTKGFEPLYHENERLRHVEELNIADEVTLGGLDDKFEVIREYRPNIIGLGYDQPCFEDVLKKKIVEFGLDTKVIRMKAYKPELYKSSKMKRRMKK